MNATKLHIVAQPSLRYRLPEVAHSVRNFLLGNATSASTFESLAVLVASFVPTEEVGSEQESMDDRFTPACAIVCTNVRGYLETLAAAWIENLAETQREATRVLRRAFAKIDEVDEVRSRLRVRHPQLVDREYQAELAQLRIDTDNAFAELAKTPVPVVSYPDVLLRNTQHLESVFAEAYTAGTDRNLASMRQFEAEMNSLQNIVARDFADRVAPMISDMMKIGTSSA